MPRHRLRRMSPALVTIPAFALMALALSACSIAGSGSDASGSAASGSDRSSSGGAAGTAGPSESATPSDRIATTALAGTQWRLVSYADRSGAQVPAAATGTLSFVGASELAGSTGCNRFTGSFTQSGEDVTIKLGAMTQMACAPAVAVQESALVAGLPRTASVDTTSAGELQLRDETGAVLLVYSAGRTSLEGSEWQAIGINDGKSAVVSSQHTEKATAAFGDGTIAGSTGCNRFSGPVTITEPDAIAIGGLAVTLAACLDDEAAAVERQYLAALAAATTYTLEGDRLTLRDSHGATQVTFRSTS